MTLTIVNKIAECDDGKPRERLLSAIRGLTFHRCQFEAPYKAASSAADLARGFRDMSMPSAPGSYTGGEMPYSLVVLPGGRVEQALEISDVGPHARRWNIPTIGVCALGDFRKHNPGHMQWAAALDLCAWLSVWLGAHPKTAVMGHDERPGATASPGKRCPGVRWPMELFRRESEARYAGILANLSLNGELPHGTVKLRAEKFLKERGLVF